jgi:hypothetical protein
VEVLETQTVVEIMPEAAMAAVNTLMLKEDAKHAHNPTHNRLLLVM